jgi:ABC-type multidrug transport system permease subunit
LARFAFLGLALSVAIFVARFQPLSVLLGFSVIVGAIMIEALCSVVKSMKV